MGRPKKVVLETPTQESDNAVPTTNAQTELVQALVQAIQSTKPVEKKTPFTRERHTPWTPTKGTPRLKLKRKMYHHSQALGSRISNEEIELLNKIRPGTYCDGFVHVIRRKDKGIDIDYKVKTSAQRLRLVNQFGIRNFKELLERIIEEAGNPAKYKTQDELDDMN